MKIQSENYDDDSFLLYLEGKLPQAERELMLASLSAGERNEWLTTENTLLALNQLPGITAPASLMTNVMAGIAPERLYANLSESERNQWQVTENALLALNQLPSITARSSLIANVMAVIAPRKTAVAPKEHYLLSQLRNWLEQHPLLGWEVSGMAVAASVLFMVLAPSVPLPFQPAQSPYMKVAATNAGVAQVAHAKFSLYAPEAHTVTLMGEFNGWGSTRELSLRPQGKGIWTVEVPLSPGRYQYAFLIDGKDMATDPRAEQHVNDDYGRKNAVLTVM